MLFSHPEVAEFMSANFECAWESVRPVPRVTIDFGTGRKLERTLHGNIVTYFCTGAGQVFDLVPGLVDPREYVRRLDQALRLNRANGWLPQNSPRSSGVRLTYDERGLMPGSGTTARAVAWGDMVTGWHQALVARARTDTDVLRDPIQVLDGTKMRIERKLDVSLTRLDPDDAESLQRDTLHNRKHRYPLASQVLLEHPFRRPAEIQNEVYARVLGVDLLDPYLGLAPDVLGGEGGRE